VPLTFDFGQSTVGNFDVGFIWDDAAKRVRCPMDFTHVHFEGARVAQEGASFAIA